MLSRAACSSPKRAEVWGEREAIRLSPTNRTSAPQAWARRLTRPSTTRRRRACAFHVARPKSDVSRRESSIAAISSSEGRRAKRLAASRTRGSRARSPAVLRKAPGRPRIQWTARSMIAAGLHAAGSAHANIAVYRLRARWRLDAGSTKNDDARVVCLTPQIKVLVEAQLARVEAFQKRTGIITPYLFVHTVGEHRGE